MQSETRWWVGAALITLVAGAPASTPAQSVPAQWPAGNGQALAARICSQCHSVEVVMRHRLTRRQWMAQIDTMISKGAKVDDDDFDALADYLAEVFGPQSAPQ
jgi:mono/diheme cytochrome c family protein